MNKKICVIPARMASSRFPGKPMVPMLGLPLILHVWNRCRLEKKFDQVIVATCDKEIFESVTAAGGEAIMTSSSHERCTDRVAEAINNSGLKLSDGDCTVMVQGDEVLVNPVMLGNLISSFEKSSARAINLISRIWRIKDFEDVNVVKVATNLNNRIIYLSRSPIPNPTRGDNVPMYQQTGIIAYTPSFLEEFRALEQTPLEILESIDMLRLIENDIHLDCVRTEIETIGVDTPVDLERAEKALSYDTWTTQYL
jgi:3-deoxy-manno-octulosonate cytidylyltransferase (CMP-KDO synthetase)